MRNFCFPYALLRHFCSAGSHATDDEIGYGLSWNRVPKRDECIICKYSNVIESLLVNGMNEAR